MIDLNHLETESNNPSSAHIDELSPLEIMQIIHAEDQKAVDAVTPLLSKIADTADRIANRIRNGGRLIYCGAGTSGRLGVLDAVECPPTYSTPPDMVTGLIAGGSDAMFRAKEGAEDDESLGESDLSSISVTKLDTVVGLSASGRTPYVIGALRYAKKNRSICRRRVLHVQVPHRRSRRHRPDRDNGRGSNHRFNTHESGNGSKNDPEYAFHRSHDSTGQGLRKFNGRCCRYK